MTLPLAWADMVHGQGWWELQSSNIWRARPLASKFLPSSNLRTVLFAEQSLSVSSPLQTSVPLQYFCLHWAGTPTPQQHIPCCPSRLAYFSCDFNHTYLLIIAEPRATCKLVHYISSTEIFQQSIDVAGSFHCLNSVIFFNPPSFWRINRIRSTKRVCYVT